MVLKVYEGDSAFTGGAAKLELLASENIYTCMYILFSVGLPVCHPVWSSRVKNLNCRLDCHDIWCS